jgi:predicted regulator of Ras-like GTPase activity (Roadblock/LC7/MglB family)
MESILKDINAVVGVTGSFVADSRGKLLAKALPDVFDEPSLETVCKTMMQTFSGLEASRRRKVGDIDMQFQQGRLIVKNLGEGCLGVLCVRRMNVPLLNLTANVAARRLHEQLKGPAPQKEAPPAAAAPAVPPAPAARRAPPGHTVDAATLARAIGPLAMVSAGGASTAAAPPAATARAIPAPEVPAAARSLPRVGLALSFLDAARERKVVLRVLGDTAVRMCSPTWAAVPEAAEELFVDLAGHARQARDIDSVLKGFGAEPNTRFNTLFGAERLRYAHPESKLPVEIFLDSLTSYHRLEFGSRLHHGEYTLPLGDLLLLLLLNVRATDRDLHRMVALLADHDLGGAGDNETIDGVLVSATCADDWGWYKTVTINLEKILAAAPNVLEGQARELGEKRVRRLRQMIEEAPKSLRWQVRARIGESRPWYEEPE